jgi:uroporphyrinogen III methyltransferase/synthase
VVTRTRQQASQLTKQFKELSAEVLEIPTIKIAPPDNLANLADAILELNSYNWIVFTSPNGVTSFFEHFFKGFDDLRDIGGVRFAAVGPATAAKLKDLHIKVDVMPSDYLASKVAKAINAYESVENLKILLLRAQVASRELPDELEKMRAIVDDVACYKTVPDTADTNGAVENLLENGADWITFTSGSTVENFNAQVNLPGLVKKFPKIKLASIGPETSKAIVALGLKPAVEAKPHTVEALVAAIQNS